jgi:predicted TIM-barrel fold metal-dependent hydrolase
MTGRIDIHHHALPPAYIEECRKQIMGPAVDLEHVMQWRPEHSLAELDENGFEKAILSISAPGIWFGRRAQTNRLARECNDYLADLRRQYPDRLGFFATMPLPDVEAARAELTRAIDELGADGVCLMTSYDSMWLGDSSFAPVFEELQRRRAAVFVHPIVPPFCRELMENVPDALAEFAFDTTRTILSLLFGGVLSRCPDVRFAFSHGGGATAMLLDRLLTFAQLRPSAGAAVPEGVIAALGRQFYDSGNMGRAAPLAALRVTPGIGQIVLATDYPYRPMSLAIPSLAEAGARADEMALIESANPRRFLG